MNIWKTSFETPSGESAGFGYGRTKKDSIDNRPSVEAVPTFSKLIIIDYSERGIIAALREHASHPDNG